MPTYTSSYQSHFTPKSVRQKSGWRHLEKLIDLNHAVGRYGEKGEGYRHRVHRVLGHRSWECTPPYLSTGISNLLQPAHAEVVLGQLSMYLASPVCPHFYTYTYPCTVCIACTVGGISLACATGLVCSLSTASLGIWNKLFNPLMPTADFLVVIINPLMYSVLWY